MESGPAGVWQWNDDVGKWEEDPDVCLLTHEVNHAACFLEDGTPRQNIVEHCHGTLKTGARAPWLSSWRWSHSP